MAALTETASYVTEFSGDYKVAVYEINPGATNGSVTTSEMTTVVAAFLSQKEDTTADCCGGSASVNGSTDNQVDIQLTEGDGTACTQNQVDFYLLVIGRSS